MRPRRVCLQKSNEPPSAREPDFFASLVISLLLGSRVEGLSFAYFCLFANSYFEAPSDYLFQVIVNRKIGDATEWDIVVYCIVQERYSQPLYFPRVVKAIPSTCDIVMASLKKNS